MARREPLNRDRVIAAALTIADTGGLDGLSMRRIAKALGVEAMSLYNHVSGKTDILDGMAERVFASIEPADPQLPWPDRVRAIALSTYRALRRHPAVPMALARDLANPTLFRALKPLDDVLGALYEAGFDDDGARAALAALNALTFGSLMLSTAGFAPEAGVADAGTDVYVRQIDPAKLPHFSRLLKTAAPADPEQDFQRALDLLLSGLTAAAR